MHYLISCSKHHRCFQSKSSSKKGLEAATTSQAQTLSKEGSKPRTQKSDTKLIHALILHSNSSALLQLDNVTLVLNNKAHMSDAAI